MTQIHLLNLFRLFTTFKSNKPGCQFIFLLSWFGPNSHGQFTNGGHVIDKPIEFVQFTANAVKFAWIWCQVVAISPPGFPTILITILCIKIMIFIFCLWKDFEPVFDTIDRAVRTKNGVLNLVQNMRVDCLWSQADFVPFWAFGLNVVLPEESFLLSRRWTCMGFPSSLLITASRIWCRKEEIVVVRNGSCSWAKISEYIPESESSKSS